MDRYFVRDVIRLIKKKKKKKNKTTIKPKGRHDKAFFSGILHQSAFTHSGTLGDIIYSLLFIQKHSNQFTA